MAATAEFGLVIKQETNNGAWGIEFVAVRTVYLLQGVCAESIAIQVLMREMASGTGRERLIAGQRSGICNIGL